MNILALDLGTKCGWALNIWYPDELMKLHQLCGVWNLKPSVHESAGQRYAKFRHELHNCLLCGKVDLIVYEEVHAHAAVDAAHVYGGLMAVVQVVAIDNKIEYRGVGVGTIKKHATGKGNAKKDSMICAAALKWPSINIISDDHADALWLLDYAQTHFAIS